MVINYSDIFDRIDQDIPQQNWYTPEWVSSSEGASLRLHKQSWAREGGGIYFECFGQGEDPEREPVILRLIMGDGVGNLQEIMDEFEDRVERDLKPIIGFEVLKEDNVFMSKELPSDPLTLHPRVLEEFTKLQSVAFRVDQLLGDAPEGFAEVDPSEEETTSPT